MPRPLGYRMIIVPIGPNPESERAMDVACRLAADHGATVVAITVVEVPPLLPIDAHMRDEEVLAHRLLERAGAIADSYGVGLVARTFRGREAAGAIVVEAAARAADLLVIGAPRRRDRRARAEEGALPRNGDRRRAGFVERRSERSRLAPQGRARLARCGPTCAA